MNHDKTDGLSAVHRALLFFGLRSFYRLSTWAIFKQSVEIDVIMKYSFCFYAPKPKLSSKGFTILWLWMIIFGSSSVGAVDLQVVDAADSLSPIPFAWVVNETSGLGVLCDDRGHVTLIAKPGDRVRVGSTAYFEASWVCDARASHVLYLRSNAVILGTVEVSSERKRTGRVPFGKQQTIPILAWGNTHSHISRSFSYRVFPESDSIWAVWKLKIKAKVSVENSAFVWLLSDSLGFPHRPLHDTPIAVMPNSGKYLELDLSDRPIVTNHQAFYVCIDFPAMAIPEGERRTVHLTNRLSDSRTFIRFGAPEYLPWWPLNQENEPMRGHLEFWEDDRYDMIVRIDYFFED